MYTKWRLVMDDINITDIETKIFQLVDKDYTIFEAEKGIFKKALQFNPVSKLYIVIRFDTAKEENEVLCITKKPTTASKLYNEAL